MAVVVEGIVRVGDKVPADEVIWMSRIAILGIRILQVGPTASAQVIAAGYGHGSQKVGAVDYAVAVLVGDFERSLIRISVGHGIVVIQIVEGDRSRYDVAIGVEVVQIGRPRSRNLRLIDPDVVCQVGMIV